MRTIRNQLKDTVLIENIHYIRPFGGRKILYIWERIETDMCKPLASAINGIALQQETIMATIRERHGMLVVDFRYHNVHCREKTNLTDSPTNRKKLGKIIEKMEAEILLGTFDYASYFPKSPKAIKMTAIHQKVHRANHAGMPSFGEFAETWFCQKQVE